MVPGCHNQSTVLGERWRVPQKVHGVRLRGGTPVRRLWIPAPSPPTTTQGDIKVRYRQGGGARAGVETSRGENTRHHKNYGPKSSEKCGPRGVGVDTGGGPKLQPDIARRCALIK